VSFSSLQFQCEVSLIDAGNNISKLQYEVQGADIAAAETSALAIVTDLVAVTKAYVQSYRVTEVFTNDSARAVPPAASVVSEKALLSLQLTTPGKKAIMYIPAPIDAMFGAAGTDAYDIVTTSNALVLALVNDFTVGAQGYVSDGENVVNNGLLAGQRVTRTRNLG